MLPMCDNQAVLVSLCSHKCKRQPLLAHVEFVEAQHSFFLCSECISTKNNKLTNDLSDYNARVTYRVLSLSQGNDGYPKTGTATKQKGEKGIERGKYVLLWRHVGVH